MRLAWGQESLNTLWYSRLMKIFSLLKPTQNPILTPLPNPQKFTNIGVTRGNIYCTVTQIAILFFMDRPKLKNVCMIKNIKFINWKYKFLCILY